MKKNNELIEKLSNKVYIYSIDNISFAKSLQKKGFDISIVNHIVQISGKLSTALLDATDSKDADEISTLVNNSYNYAKQSLKLLQEVNCKDELLNEKANLIIETYEIIKQIEQIK